MKHRLNWLVAVLLILTLALAACGGDTAPAAEDVEPVVEEAAEVVEEAAEVVEPETVEEPAAEEPAEAEETAPEPAPVVSEAELDEAFNGFLAEMERYNTINLEGLNEQLVEDPPPFL
ncbi:MAG: hypothetical protein R3300_13920, partial [Candidatus Promineifilaceae bacterium]|nr:hypothetical protein [Candidatus Promineifilaceae bacterium]